MALLALACSSGAVAGPYESARYLHWTGQDEAAAALLEPWLAKNPDDLEAHSLYIEIRVAGMGEGQVLKTEYQAWQAPNAEVKAGALEALNRALRGDRADAAAKPLPSRLNRRWVNYLLKHWEEEPAKLRAAVVPLWGLDAPIGKDADNLRAGTLLLVDAGAKSGDPMWLEARRATLEAAELPSQEALQQLTEVDSKAWPGRLNDDAQRQVLVAARAVSPTVALERLDKLVLPAGAADGERLRHAIRGQLLTELGKPAEALKALELAWRADPTDPDATIEYAAAAIRADGSIEVATKAVRGTLDAIADHIWNPDSGVDGMLWAEAYTRLYSERRVDVGTLDRLRKSLDRMVRTQTKAPVVMGPIANAAHHLEEGVALRGRVGTRHLVEAVRLAQVEGNKQVEADARALLTERSAYFVGGLDAAVAGWNATLGDPRDLRPDDVERTSLSLRGEPLTDFAMRIGGIESRLMGLPGTRVLAAVSADCDTCGRFLRDLDAEARAVAEFGFTWLAVDTTGDAVAMDSLFEGADLVLKPAYTTGGLPEDFTEGGVPRLFVVSADGVVLRDTGLEPTREEMGLALRAAVAEVAVKVVEVAPDLDAKGEPIEGTGGPEALERVAPNYPPAALFIGAPMVQCMSRAVVRPDGTPLHIESAGFCNEPFVTSTREALEQWRWEVGDSYRDSIVVIDYAKPEAPSAELAPAECVWWASPLREGTLTQVVSNCPPGTVRPAPVPWSESPRTDSARVDSNAGSVVIHNVDLPAPCDVVLDVGRTQIDLGSDPGTCTEAVRADALDRVRRWDWDVGVGRDVPVRVVLHFEPPRR